MHQGPWHRSEDFLPNRLLKNAHQSRASRDFPYPSPCQARSRLIAAYLQVRLIPQDCLPDRQVKTAAGAPVNGISKTQLASACLPKLQRRQGRF